MNIFSFDIENLINNTERVLAFTFWLNLCQNERLYYFCVSVFFSPLKSKRKIHHQKWALKKSNTPGVSLFADMDELLKAIAIANIEEKILLLPQLLEHGELGINFLINCLSDRSLYFR